MNKRLNTTNLQLTELFEVMHQRGIKGDMLLAEPEIEGVEYSDGQSYMCSAFVAGLWKAAGYYTHLYK